MWVSVGRLVDDRGCLIKQQALYSGLNWSEPADFLRTPLKRIVAYYTPPPELLRFKPPIGVDFHLSYGFTPHVTFRRRPVVSMTIGHTLNQKCDI